MKFLTKLFLVFVFFGFILLFFQLYKDSSIKEKIESRFSEKVIEINTTKINGFSDGKISWEMSVEKIWTGRNKYLFWAENIKSGKIYNAKGRLLIKDIKAKTIKANSRSKKLTLENYIEATFIRKDKSTTTNNSEKFARIKASEMNYFDTTKKAYFTKEVLIEENDYKIFCNGAEVDTDQNIINITNKFLVSSDEFKVSGDILNIYLDENFAEIYGNVKGKKVAKRPSSNIDEREASFRKKDAFITCDYFKFTSTAENNSINISGNINISQEDKLLLGDYGYYEKGKNIYYIEGNAYFTCSNLNWLLTKESFNKLRNKEVKKSIDMPLVLNADRIIFDAEKKIVSLFGNISLIQEDKFIGANTIEFMDKEKTIGLHKNVSIIKNKEDRLDCNKLIINIDKESFDADQIKDTEFRVEKNEDNK